MEDRRKILQSLIEFSLPISDLSDELTSLDWDYEGPSVILLTGQLAKVLRRYLANDLNKEEIEWWADLIECRDGIDYDKEITKEIIHKLSNPALEGEITANSCNHMLSALKSN